MRKREIVIYDDFSIGNDFDELKQELLEEYPDTTDDDVWNEIYFNQDMLWQETETYLEKFFDDGFTWILQGMMGRWNGSFHAGFIFHSLRELLDNIIENSPYFSLKLYDKGGHFYIETANHDASSSYEIKKLTKRGEQYLDNWEYGSWNDKRTEEYVHTQIMKRYSILPRFAEKMYA